MVVVNFYHPTRKRLIAKIKALDAVEALNCFRSSLKKGYEVRPRFIGRTEDEEIKYLYLDLDSLEDRLPNDEILYEEEEAAS